MNRAVVAVIASFPVAVVAGISLGLAINLPGALSTAFFWLVWGGSIVYSLREAEPKRVFGRTAIAYAVAAFSLPLTATKFALTGLGAVESDIDEVMAEAEGPVEGFIALLLGAALAEVFLVLSLILGVFGILSGLIAVVWARTTLKSQDDRKAV